VTAFDKLKCMVVAALWVGTATADPLMDFSMFNPPEVSQRKIAEPMVSWLIRSSPEAVCTQAQPKDGLAKRPEGCVYWHLASARCTIVTTTHTSHSQLGHLFLHCLQGR
jgi:hypothetical protein